MAQFVKLIHIIMCFLFGFLLVFAVAPASAQHLSSRQDPDSIEAYQGIKMKASFSRNLASGRIGKVGLSDIGALQVFYAQRGYNSYWINESGLNSKAHALVSLLQDSWTHGLNPEKYHLKEIERLLGRSYNRSRESLEMLLTDAAVLYAQDLSGMRIDPEPLKQKRKYWKQPDGANSILGKLQSSDDIVRTLEAFAPQDMLYQYLRKELINLASVPEQDFSSVLPLDFGKQYFFPGDRSKSVAGLRVRFGFEKSDSSIYDDNLAQAVMAFQRENNLEPDGIIGPKTLDLLNQSNHKKILQIIANLERLRWLDRELPERYILVNTASQMLWAVEDGRVALQMKVVNGKPWRRTKEFKTYIKGIRFNPDWTIPPGIKRYDIWPKVKKDPGYLHEKGIEVIRGYGSEAVKLDPYAIDWKNLSVRELHELRLVGVPGESNPLGYVRVLMPNDYNMYLHDTNHRDLFAKPERTYSSGCIRVERPYDIAEFVLKNNKDWDNKMVPEIIMTGEKTDISAEEYMPVYIIHQTAWLDGYGNVVFGADIYKRDHDLIEVLESANGFKMPSYEEITSSHKTKILASNNPVP